MKKIPKYSLGILGTICALAAAASLEGCAHSVPEIKSSFGFAETGCKDDAGGLEEAVLIGERADGSHPYHRYHCEEGKPVGKQYHYFPSGKVERDFSYNKDGLMDGIFKVFYESGKLDAVMNFVNGEEEGLEVGLYEDGSLESVSFYKHGKEEGFRVSWHNDGRLETVWQYQGGELKGWHYTLNFEADGFENINCFESEVCERKTYFSRALEDEQFRQEHLDKARKIGEDMKQQALEFLAEHAK